MLIIQLIRDYLNGEKMPERIRYGMMQDGYQYFRWDAEAEEYVCEADDKCFLSLVPWHHLRDFVEVAEQTEPQMDYDKGLQLFADILFDKEKSEQFLKECKTMGIEPQTEREGE